MLYEVSIFVFVDVLSITELGGKDARFSFLTLLHVVLWLVVMTCHFLLWLQHYQLQLRGYLNFCHTTQKLRIIPPLVMTFGNTILHNALCACFVISLLFATELQLMCMP